MSTEIKQFYIFVFIITITASIFTLLALTMNLIWSCTQEVKQLKDMYISMEEGNYKLDTKYQQ